MRSFLSCSVYKIYACMHLWPNSLTVCTRALIKHHKKFIILYMHKLYNHVHLCIKLHILEATEKIYLDLHEIVLKCFVWWTRHSVVASAGLSRTGLISSLCILLHCFIEKNSVEKVRNSLFIVEALPQLNY